MKTSFRTQKRAALTENRQVVWCKEVLPLRTGAQTHFMGQAEPCLGRAVTWSKHQSGGFSDMHWTEAWSCSHSPARTGSKGDTGPEHEALWRTSSKYRAMTEESTLPSVTSTGVTSKSCPCCRRLRRWWSVVHTQSNPRSAWKRQYSRVRACDQRDNAGRHWCERVLPKACCRNSHCEGLYHFLCEMGFDLAKDQAHRAPCELLRQLMYQSHLKPSAKTPHNPTLCDEPYSFVWITQELLKLGHSEILPYRYCIDSWKTGK